jgi:hypothetical protein
MMAAEGVELKHRTRQTCLVTPYAPFPKRTNRELFRVIPDIIFAQRCQLMLDNFSNLLA